MALPLVFLVLTVPFDRHAALLWLTLLAIGLVCAPPAGAKAEAVLGGIAVLAAALLVATGFDMRLTFHGPPSVTLVPVHYGIHSPTGTDARGCIRPAFPPSLSLVVTL